jgi:hypothetical protein
MIFQRELEFMRGVDLLQPILVLWLCFRRHDVNCPQSLGFR